MSEQNPALASIHNQLQEVEDQVRDNIASQRQLISDLWRTRREDLSLLDKRESLKKAVELLSPPNCASNEPAPPPANPVIGGELTIDGEGKAKLTIDLVGQPKTTLEFPAPPDGHPIAAALKTLATLGYEHTGGVEWRPPYGSAPVFDDEQARLMKAVFEARENYRTNQAGLSRDELDRLAAYLKQGGKFAGDIPNAMNAIKAAMAKDLGYAWAWQCNIAGPMADALQRLGIELDRRESNYAAAALMRHMFDVDMDRDAHYRASQKKEPVAAPEPDPFADKIVRLKDGPGDLYRYIGRDEKTPTLAIVEDSTAITLSIYAELLEVVPASEGGYPEETPEQARELEAIAAKPLRPVIAYPARRLGLVLTHATIGDDLFTGAVRLALQEFADYQYEAETSMRPRFKPSYPFAASNGVTVDVEPWLTVDADDERPGAPIPRAGEAAIAAAAEAAKDLKAVGEAVPRQDVATWLLKTTKSPATLEAWLPLTEHPGYALHIARSESGVALMRARGVARLLENPVPVGLKTVFEANNSIWTAAIDPLGKNMHDSEAGESITIGTVPAGTTIDDAAGFFELGKTLHAGAVAPQKQPIKVNLTYDWAQFVNYGLEQAELNRWKVTNGLAWSFQFHGHQVTHENDSCYIVEGNAPSESLYFHRGDIITVDSESGRISIKSPATPDALAPALDEQAVKLDMGEITAQALDTLKVPMSAPEKLEAIAPTIGRRVWFHPDPNMGSTGFVVNSKDQPLNAGVVYVWSDRMVNLDVTDHAGNHHAFTSVTLVQPGDPAPGSGSWCEWMPYQVKQAQVSK
jgi:hypothetical protein